MSAPRERSAGSLAHHTFATSDGVRIHAVETGNESGPPILFVHGLTQSWRAWLRQLADPALRRRFRLIALDLRGHGDSEGASGASDPDGFPLGPLPAERYRDGTVQGDSRLWAHDVEAVIEHLDLSRAVLVGWSYGGVVVQGYLHAHGGFGAAAKAMLLSTTPVLMPPGSPGSETDLAATRATVSAFVRMLPVDPSVEPPAPNDDATIARGLVEFVSLCFADDTDRAQASTAEIQSAAGVGLVNPPEVRLAILARAFDFRPFLSQLPDDVRRRIHAVTPQAGRVFQTDMLNRFWEESRVSNTRVPLEGHGYMWRNPGAFNALLERFAEGD